MLVDTEKTKRRKSKKTAKNRTDADQAVDTLQGNANDANHDAVLDKAGNANSNLQDKFAETMAHSILSILKGKAVDDLSWADSQRKPGALKLKRKKLVISFAGDSQGGRLSMTPRISCGNVELDINAFMEAYGKLCVYTGIHVTELVAKFMDAFPGIQVTCELTIPVASKQKPNGMDESA